MDFIAQLTQVQGYNGIMFVVDHFSKYDVFVPTKIPCGAEQTMEFFFKNIVKKRVGEVAYELELPCHMHMKHPVFHLSQLKRCRLDSDHPERAEPSRGPAGIVDKPGLELEKILSLKTIGVGCHMRREFLCRWKNAPEEKSWESEDSLWRLKDKIKKYNRKLMRRAGLSRATMISSGGGCNALQVRAWACTPPVAKSD